VPCRWVSSQSFDAQEVNVANQEHIKFTGLPRGLALCGLPPQCLPSARRRAPAVLMRSRTDSPFYTTKGDNSTSTSNDHLLPYSLYLSSLRPEGLTSETSRL